ncbi:hypothetical protein [Flavobacterium album]|nr:hypothetical protein [Flavobacterium album]
MKKLVTALLLMLPFLASANVLTDTITNWQVYKDGKLVFKSNDGNKKIYTVSLNKEDKFKTLELHIGSDIGTNETKRKLLFWQGDKLIYTSVKAVKPHVSTTLVLTKEELLRAVGPDIDKTFTVTYVEGSGNDGRVVFQLVVH